MSKLNKTVLQRYNATRRFLCTLDEQQIALLIDALDNSNSLQVTQTQVDSAYDAMYDRAYAEFNETLKKL
jgi:hypothetical protein